LLIKRILLPLLASITLPIAFKSENLIVHGGLLNGESCHNDKKNNSYYCYGLTNKENSNSNNSEYINIESCYDGDTCKSTKGEKIRLACIDTPELRGANADPVPAKEARDYINSLVAGRDVGIRRITKDRYGRTVAELSINSINIQQIMVINGYAKIYSKYAYQCPWAR
tara:strand:- start:90 stop:596 length:507 start_codon:yes stop_codon:yes gene_type:complete